MFAQNLEAGEETDMNVNLLTVKGLSNMLGVKEKTLYQWAELKQIPHIKLNGCLRFDVGDIEKWIVGCKRGYNEGAKIVAGSPRKGGK